MAICTKPAPQSAQIEVSADGVRAIPTDIGIKLVRDLFEGIGVDRLREDRYFMNLSFEDVSELVDDELTEAVAVGLDYLAAEPANERSAVKAALVARVEAQLGDLNERLHFRVGAYHSKACPKPAMPAA
ncbi:hypothetical protein [Burkholderia sp. LMU1-1-1.1]|uniref:hypothetical protein n=1 Tax=Burkholderia sp. LMU1-1-1.1 TaxID=3135266 RepID=UPI00343C6784